VVDHDVLPELLAELGRERARDVVGRAAGRLGNDHADRPIGILGRRVAGKGQQRGVKQSRLQLCWVSWPPTSPPLFFAVWTFTYRPPSLNAFICASFSLAP